MNDLLLNFQVKGKTVAVDDTTIFYQDRGDGEVILLLHGFLGTSFTYYKVIEDLAKDHRVIAPDLPGFGFSSTPKDPISHRLLAKKLQGFLKALEIEKLHIVAHDYSGPILFLLLNDNPDIIKSLTVTNSFLNISKFHRYFPLNLLRIPGLGYLLSFLLTSGILRLIFNQHLMEKPNELTDEESVALQYLFCSEQRRSSFLSAIRNIDKTVYAKRDMESGVRKMVGLRQILIGEGDRLISPYHTEYLMEMMRISMAVRIPSGHFPMLENPADFITKIRNIVQASHGVSHKKKVFHFQKSSSKETPETEEE